MSRAASRKTKVTTKKILMMTVVTVSQRIILKIINLLQTDLHIQMTTTFIALLVT